MKWLKYNIGIKRKKKKKKAIFKITITGKRVKHGDLTCTKNLVKGLRVCKQETQLGRNPEVFQRRKKRYFNVRKLFKVLKFR